MILGILNEIWLSNYRQGASMARILYRMLSLLVVMFITSCASLPTMHDYTANQTGLVACKFATETMPPLAIQHEEAVYGEGTVQSRTQARNGIADCYKKLGQE